MTREFVERGLVVNRRVEEYDGTTAVTRSTHLAAEDIEFMRWKAERWMKVRQFPWRFRHDPRFVLRNGRQMLAHTFRGIDVAIAGRARERTHGVPGDIGHIRAREREYVDWPDPLADTAGNGPVPSARARSRDRRAVGPAHTPDAGHCGEHRRAGDDAGGTVECNERQPPKRPADCGHCRRPPASCSMAWCSGGMPWTRMPPPTRNIAAVPATDRPFISHGATREDAAAQAARARRTPSRPCAGSGTARRRRA